MKKNLTYDEERLVTDRELLRRHYQKNGYADASISPPQSEFDTASGTFGITFTIDEGERYSFGAVSVVSDLPEVDMGSCRSCSPPGQVKRTTAFSSRRPVDKLALALADKGHNFARALSSTTAMRRPAPWA